MVITKIEPQKKHKNRSSVFLDGSFAFGISDFDVLRFHLKEGETLTENALETIRNEVLVQDAQQYALRLLDCTAYTEQALRRKLKEHGCDSQTIDRTIAFLAEYRYVDDRGFARRYINAALNTGRSGMRKIQYDLMGKGIARDIIEEICAEFDNEELRQNEYSAVLPLLEKKLKGDYSFPNIMKAKRYCLSRGFSQDAIDSAIRQLKNSEEEWLDA